MPLPVAAGVAALARAGLGVFARIVARVGGAALTTGGTATRGIVKFLGGATRLPRIRFAAALKGQKKLLRNFVKLGNIIASLDRIMLDAAEELLATAKKEAPVLTGRLRKHIRIASPRLKRPGEVGIIVRTGTPGEMRLKGNFNYPFFVHEGRQPTAENNMAVAISPNPFMRRALNKSRRGITRRAAKNLRKEIVKLVR